MWLFKFWKSCDNCLKKNPFVFTNKNSILLYISGIIMGQVLKKIKEHEDSLNQDCQATKGISIVFKYYFVRVHICS